MHLSPEAAAAAGASTTRERRAASARAHRIAGFMAGRGGARRAAVARRWRLLRSKRRRVTGRAVEMDKLAVGWGYALSVTTDR